MASLNDRFSLVQAALTYLDTRDGLHYVKICCSKFNKGEELLVYYFKLDVDPAVLTDLNAVLGNLVLLKPFEASEVFQEVVFQIAQELELLPSDTTLSQIAVTLRLASLPIPFSSIDSAKDLSLSSGKSTYVQLNGLVTGITGISKYTQSTKYVCPIHDCDGNEGNRFIRVHIAGASETQTVRKDFTCSVCHSILEEDKSSRILADKLLAEVIPEGCLHDSHHSKNVGRRAQSISVYIRDELCEKVHVGQKYHIIGMVRTDFSGDNLSIALEANNLLELTSRTHNYIMSSLPDSILNLHNDRRDSPWSFAMSLAYVFGGEICSPGSYFKLKLGLLLSLAAASEEKLLHIIGLGSEVEVIRRLMDYSRCFCGQTVCHMAGSHLAGKVINDRHATAPYFLEGGSLLLAADGVCYMGDLMRLKKKDLEQLQAALSSNKAYLDLGSKHTGGLPQQSLHNIRCQIWAYADNLPLKSAKHAPDSISHLDNGSLPKVLLDGFGCVFYTDCDDSATRDDVDTQTACQMLMQAMETEQSDIDLPVSTQDFQELFKYLSAFHTKMTSEAQRLLTMYFLSIRKVRSGAQSGTEVALTALQALTSLAHGHAKLSLRHQVLEEDALAAVRIYEENLTARFGISPLNLLPRSHVPAHCFDDFIGPENDRAMHQFHVLLVRFCGGASWEE